MRSGGSALRPALFLPLGGWAWLSVLVNSLLAEAVTNAHAFLMIVPNHAGDDLYRFDGPVKGGKGEFYVRQIVGSANYRCGGRRERPAARVVELPDRAPRLAGPDAPAIPAGPAAAPRRSANSSACRTSRSRSSGGSARWCRSPWATARCGVPGWSA